MEQFYGRKTEFSLNSKLSQLEIELIFETHFSLTTLKIKGRSLTKLLAGNTVLKQQKTSFSLLNLYPTKFKSTNAFKCDTNSAQKFANISFQKKQRVFTNRQRQFSKNHCRNCGLLFDRDQNTSLTGKPTKVP